MGGFYGSIQFRSDDRDSVLQLAEAIAKDGECKFLCGPPLGGWVGLYPSGNGQDERVASTVAERWSGELLYVVVHDDDVLMYRYFQAGKRLDSYWSAPGYFGDADREAQEVEAGKPEVYAHLIRGSPERVRTLLARGTDRSKPKFEIERLLAFAKLLGIANLGTAYEYLQNGEREGIRGWRQFVHVPEGADERSVARRAKAVRDVEHKRLMAAGLLLAVHEARDRRVPTVVEFRGRPLVFEQSTRQDVAHPDGSFRVTATIDSIEVRALEGAVTRTLLVGLQSATVARENDRSIEIVLFSSALTELEPGRALARLLGYVPPERRATIEQHLRRVLPPPPWSTHHAACLAQLVAYSMTASEGAGHLSFSRDGSWLVCCTRRGLRVAAWSDVLRSSDGTSVPWRYSFDVPPYELVSNPGHGNVYAAVHDAVNDCVVFGGIDGRLRTMSLSDGHVEELLELHERAALLQMTMIDPTTLALVAHPGFPIVRAKGPKPIVYVWNYAALTERARSGVRPVNPPLEPHALVPIANNDDAPPSPVLQVVTLLRASQATAPRELTVERLTECDWPDAVSRERLVKPLLAAGFSSSERFVVPALPDTLLQFFAKPDECITGTLTKTPQSGTTLTLGSARSDGTSFAYTNTPRNGLDVPPGRTVRHAAGADGGALLDLIRRHRPAGPWLSLTVDVLPKRFESNYAKQWAWRDGHGFSQAEAMRYILERGRAG